MSLLENLPKIEDLSLHPRLQHKRLWTVNGAIINPNTVYYVPIEDTNQTLLDLIEKGQFLLLQGRRGSGKSTLCWSAIRKLEQKYTCFMVSLQSGIQFNMDLTRFWTSFGRNLMKQFSVMMDREMDNFYGVSRKRMLQNSACSSICRRDGLFSRRKTGTARKFLKCYSID